MFFLVNISLHKIYDKTYNNKYIIEDIKTRWWCIEIYDLLYIG